MGADDYETLDEIERTRAQGLPPLGIGSDTVIRNAIVDKNARIGQGVRLVNEAGVEEKDGEGYFILDRIVIVPKGSMIADGTVV